MQDDHVAPSGRVITRIPDGDGGWIYAWEVTGPKGRARLRISRREEGSRDDLRIGPKAALELVKRLNGFIYHPASRRRQ